MGNFEQALSDLYNKKRDLINQIEKLENKKHVIDQQLEAALKLLKDHNIDIQPILDIKSSTV